MRSAVLSWAAFAMADDPLGITTALSAMAGFAAMPFVGGETVGHNAIGPRPYRVFRMVRCFWSALFLGHSQHRSVRDNSVSKRAGGVAPALWAAGHLIERAAVNIVRN